MKSDDPARVFSPDGPPAPHNHDPHESLIPDPRAGLSPAELVERKLMAVLHGGRQRKGERGA